jgi:diguanylate cyclase (GGDEF)-like protein/putative nucleotidyltransferase with HDIG domain
VGFRELCDEGQRLERDGQNGAARATYEQALRMLEPGLGGASATTVLRWIARTWQADAAFDEALACLEAAYAAAEAEGDERAIGHAQNLHAIVWWRLGGLDEARDLYLKAREGALSHGDQLLAAMTAQNLGVIAAIRGDQDQALTYYDSALREYRQLEMHRDACIALNNRGLLLTRMGRWADARTAFEESLALARRVSDDDIRTQLEVNIAALTVARGDYDAAQGEVLHALARARARDDLNAVAEALKLAGIVARARKNHDAAEVHFRDAMRIAEARQNALLLAELHREFALLYRAAGRNRELFRSLNSAHRMFSQLKARHDLADIERTTRDLEGEFIDVAHRWGESTESKDRYTQGHCERVADVATEVARRVGFDEQALFWFRIGTLLHDVGKLVIPEEVLNKPGRLTADEWETVKQHPLAGVDLLSDIEFPWDITPIVRSHHEYWDGSGYPDGLVGADIPMEARIVCLADVYDALTTERSYKRALSHDEAVTLMRRDIGRQFDPDLFQIFAEVVQGRGGKVAEVVPTVDEPARVVSHTRDELTGLLLRRAFVDAAAQRLAEARESNVAPVTLAVIDVDSFKSVNDTFGHLQGDEVLRVVARILTEGIRDFDLAGRYAGDEFVLLLRADAREALQVCERLRETVARARIPLTRGEEGEVGVSLSIGLGTAPAHGDTFETLFAAADRALYDSKRKGRNMVSTAGGQEARGGKPRLDVERFVGRTEEIGRLVQHFEASVRGEPRIVALVGEAGVGKTTLVRRIGSEVRLRTGLMVFGRSQEPDVRPPYGPWVDVIAGLSGLGVLPERRWPELERLIPSLRPAGADLGPQVPGSKYALLDEIVDVIRLVAASRPLVIVLDDMQWGDTASWDAVEHLVGQLERERVLVCLTIRREDADRIERSRQRLSRSERYHELQIGRLLPSEVRSWVMAALRQSAVEDELPDALYRFTEGNPLFVKQVLQSLFDDGLLWHNGTDWEWKQVDAMTLPTAVDDLMDRRLSRLSPSGSRLLAVAAVFGRSFDFDDVVRAADTTDNALLDAVDEGISVGVIEAVGASDPNEYHFVHGLLADALKRDLNPRRLQLIQRRVAETLEERRPHASAEIASLFDHAGDAARAYRHALAAAERASAVYALDDAARALRIAVRSALSPAERYEAKSRLLRVAQLAGQYGEAARLADELAEEASGDDAPALRLAARRAGIELRALTGESAATTLASLELLLQEAGQAEAYRERVLLLTLISDLHARHGSLGDAQRLAREARGAAIQLDDRELWADATIRLGTALLDTAPDAALKHFTEAGDLYAAAGHRFGNARCLVNAGIAYQRLGQAAEAELSYREALAMAEGANVIDLVGLAALNLGVLLTRAGRYDAAEEQFQRAMKSFAKVKNEPRRAATLYNLAHLAYEQGDAAKAQGLAQASADLATELGITPLRQGALARVGLAALALGDTERVTTVATTLEREPTPNWFTGRECVEAFQSRLALHQGNTVLAQRAFIRAAEALGGDPYDLAWLVAECSALFRSAAATPDMRRVAVRARREAERLGFSPLAKRLALVAVDDPAVLVAR